MCTGFVSLRIWTRVLDATPLPLAVATYMGEVGHQILRNSLKYSGIHTKVSQVSRFNTHNFGKCCYRQQNVSLIFFVTTRTLYRCNWKVQINFEHKFHISRQYPSISISMCPETFNLWIKAKRIHYGGPAYFSHAVRDVLNNTYHQQWTGIEDPLHGLHNCPILILWIFTCDNT
jgi:hypothetical protein